MDLLAQVPDLRFAGRQIIGVDNSPAMLAKAQETGAPIAA